MGHRRRMIHRGTWLEGACTPVVSSVHALPIGAGILDRTPPLGLPRKDRTL